MNHNDNLLILAVIAMLVVEILLMAVVVYLVVEMKFDRRRTRKQIIELEKHLPYLGMESGNIDAAHAG